MVTGSILILADIHPDGGGSMNDFSDFGPSNKEMAALILVVLIVLVGAFGCGYLLGVERTQDIHDNGGGAAGAGQQIEQAGADIQHAADGIKEAAGTADKIGAGIKDAAGTAQYIHSTAADSAGIVAECQSILARVRARGAQDAPTH